MKLSISAAAALTAICAVPHSANAHHGVGGQFDLSQEYEVSGIVTEIGWVNPHAYVYFDVTNDDGEVEAWRCELRAAGVLERSGWDREMFATGTQITILGSPARREANTCYVQTIAFNGGEAMYRYAQLGGQSATTDALAAEPDGEIPARLADGRPNISGDWAAEQQLPSYDVVLERNLGPRAPGGRRVRGVTIELTDAGEAALAALAADESAPQTDEEGRTLQSGTGTLECVPRSFFRDWTFDQHVNRIIQRGNTITMRYGFMDVERTIHMDVDEHPTDLEPALAGHSIGRWDGDVLVVDTMGFSSSNFGSVGPGIVRSDQYRVIERFELDPANQTLRRSWSAEDPLYWQDSASGEDTVARADVSWQLYGCDDRTNENVTN
jgi:hypothetical protein